MKNIQIGSSNIQASEIALGCMRMAELDEQQAVQVLEASKEAGINFFDHADIYGSGKSEEVFSKALAASSFKREDVFLQTKCGIRQRFFDFSKDHIVESAEESIKRLNTDYVDLLLLHRPDTLMEPEEVAEAFRSLKESGKVKHFGVSNHTPYQIELLKRYIGEDLLVNQLQLSVMHTPLIDAELNANMQNRESVNRTEGLLAYSRLNNITIQAWSPFQFGMIEGTFIGNEKFPEVNQKLTELAEKYGVTDSAIAIAWILRHPASIQPIIGSMNTERIKHIAEASNVKLTREEWYNVYTAAGNNLP